MKIVTNVKIYDYETYIENGYCIFDDKIIEVGEMKDFPGAKGREEIIDGKNKILLPGLINFHTHIYSTLVRGASIPFNPKSFKDILEQLWWKFDSKLDNETTFHSAMVYGLESLKNGVTSLIDHHASGLMILGSLNELKRAFVDTLGMRGVFCFETSDRFDVNSCIKENLAGLKFNTPEAKGMFGLHASMSLSEETLNKVSEVLGNTPIHVHVAESKEDEEDSLQKYKMTVVERYQKHGLLNPDSILAHCVHINENEAKLISENGAYVVFNPTSNMNNAVGTFNIELFRKYNIPLMIGTDGLGTNIAKEWTNLYYVGKAGLKDPVGIGLDEIRNYVIKSYEYFSRMMSIKIGKIKKDYVADLVLVDYINPTQMDETNTFGHLFFGLFDNFRPSWVFCRGKTLIKNYTSKFNEEEVYRNALNASQKLWQRLGDS
ncbi:MAG: amidohydrolase family protein [Candidatus Heimdallarchaeaceae archaeon]